jgi:hypothetical protein
MAKGSWPGAKDDPRTPKSPKRSIWPGKAFAVVALKRLNIHQNFNIRQALKLLGIETWFLREQRAFPKAFQAKSW